MNRILIAVSAAVALFGCASTPEPVPAPAPEAEPVPPPYVPQVNTIATANPVAVADHVAFKQVVLDGFQAQSVSVQDVRRSKTNDGYEKVQVFIKNLTAESIRTRYRFNWQDANGVDVIDADHDGWEKETLVPGDDGVFTSIAPRKDCADFKLRMQTVR